MHTGSPKGSIKSVADTRIYFSYPPGKEYFNGILLFPDANGIDQINTQLIADEYARQGYLVLVPDLFHDDPCRTSTVEELYQWLALHPVERVDPVVELTLKEMWRLGCMSIAGVGYCFGAKYVIRNLTGLEGKLSAGFVAHPSFVTAEELGAIQKPLSIAAAGKKGLIVSQSFAIH
jgi:dienelactone hydrolase